MKNPYLLRLYQPGDETQIVQLFQRVFKGWPSFDLRCTSLDHWKWKYLDPPFETQIVVGVSEDRIISCYHRHFPKIKVGDRILAGAIGIDLAVHEDFRKSGVSNDMIDFLYERDGEVEHHINHFFTGHPMLIKSYEKRYPRFPHSVVSLVRIRDIDLDLRMRSGDGAWAKKGGFHALRLMNALKTLPKAEASPGEDLLIREVSEFDDRFDRFWARIKNDYAFILARPRAYLNWRYADHRGGDYMVKTAESEGRILGFIVLRSNAIRPDYPVGYIMDFLTLPGRPEVASALVADGLRHLDEAGVNLVNFWCCRNGPYADALSRNGFLRPRSRPHVFYKPMGDRDYLECLKTEPPGRIHFPIGDTDYI